MLAQNRPQQPRYKATVVKKGQQQTGQTAGNAPPTPSIPTDPTPAKGLRTPGDDKNSAPKELPKSITLDTSLLQDIRRSLKVLGNDLAIITDLIDQKLGLKPEEGEEVNESTLARRKDEDLQKQKIAKG